MKTLCAGLISVIFALPSVRAQEDESALKRYRDLRFPAEPAKSDNGFKAFDNGWQDRVALEFEISTPLTSSLSGWA